MLGGLTHISGMAYNHHAVSADLCGWPRFGGTTGHVDDLAA